MLADFARLEKVGQTAHLALHAALNSNIMAKQAARAWWAREETGTLSLRGFDVLRYYLERQMLN
jgi:hypothetical protein